MSYGSLFFDKTQMNGKYCVDILIPLFHCYMRYAIDSCKLQKKLGWEPVSIQPLFWRFEI